MKECAHVQETKSYKLPPRYPNLYFAPVFLLFGIEMCFYCAFLIFHVDSTLTSRGFIGINLALPCLALQVLLLEWVL